MELTKAENLAKALMKKHGLVGRGGWTFEFDNAVRGFGCCRPSKRKITLSRKLTRKNSEKEVKDTILHEIAHTLAGCQNGHNEVWKAKCRQIGANPERCYDAVKVKQPEHKYKMRCKDCGKVSGRHRMCSFIKNPERWRCGVCGGKFERIR